MNYLLARAKLSQLQWVQGSSSDVEVKGLSWWPKLRPVHWAMPTHLARVCQQHLGTTQLQQNAATPRARARGRPPQWVPAAATTKTSTGPSTTWKAAQTFVPLQPFCTAPVLTWKNNSASDLPHFSLSATTSPIEIISCFIFKIAAVISCCWHGGGDGKVVSAQWAQ